MLQTPNTTARQHRAWVQQLRDRTGLAVATIAKQAGVAPSTLTRLMADNDGSSTLHAATIAKLAAWAGVPPPAGEITPAGASAPRALMTVEEHVFNAIDALRRTGAGEVTVTVDGSTVRIEGRCFT